MSKENGSNVSADAHKHHWFIEQSNGPTSKGICHDCRITKTFFNALDDVLDEEVLTGPYSTPDSKKTKFRAGNKLAYTKAEKKIVGGKPKAITAKGTLNSEAISDNAA